MIGPYLRRLGLTSGQASTLALGLVLAGLLLATSMPPVLDQRNRTRPPAQQEAPLVLASPAAPTPSVVAAPTPIASRPGLRVTESGYSTTDDAAGRGIPAGALPVGVRAGVPVLTSYVRLAGPESQLTLAVSSAAGASLGPSSPSLQACRIRSAAWRGGRPGPAVPYDGSACAPGVLGAAGRYSFDLSRFAAPDDPRGFAIAAVPGGSTQTYRVSLIPMRSSS